MRVVVVVAAVIRGNGRILITRRPPHVHLGDLWEFPGGKLEPGETVDQALRRELQEEIGVTIGPAELWRIEEFDYPHARVRLHFCRVQQWTGVLVMHEGQQMSWERLPARCAPLLPATEPVLQWLADELH